MDQYYTFFDTYLKKIFFSYLFLFIGLIDQDIIQKIRYRLHKFECLHYVCAIALYLIAIKIQLHELKTYCNIYTSCFHQGLKSFLNTSQLSVFNLFVFFSHYSRLYRPLKNNSLILLAKHRGRKSSDQGSRRPTQPTAQLIPETEPTELIIIE